MSLCDYGQEGAGFEDMKGLGKEERSLCRTLRRLNLSLKKNAGWMTKLGDVRLIFSG